MVTKYDKYLGSRCCKNILASQYAQMIENIILDNELYITEAMKIEFFQYLEKHNGTSDFIVYCDTFFDEPKSASLNDKKYILKGEIVNDQIYTKDIGRVARKSGFRRAINSALLEATITRKSKLSPISDAMDDFLVDAFILNYEDSDNDSDKLFCDFLEETGIANFTIQDQPMWTFDGYYDEDVYRGYEIKDLPCILGLPGPDRTATDYLSIERITFSIKLPKEIVVRKPTSFDAGTMPVWRIGGKTKTHNECSSKYGPYGFEEFIHEPIKFKYITSGLYKL